MLRGIGGTEGNAALCMIEVVAGWASGATWSGEALEPHGISPNEETPLHESKIPSVLSPQQAEYCVASCLSDSQPIICICIRSYPNSWDWMSGLVPPCQSSRPTSKNPMLDLLAELSQI
jgi:hypothetical protein